MIRAGTFLVKVASVAVVGAYAFKTVRQFLDNSIVIYIFEQLTLPSEASDSFTELSFPIVGEIRVATNLVARSTFHLRTNGRLEGTEGFTSPKQQSTRASNASDVDEQSWRTLDSSTGTPLHQSSQRSASRVILRKPVLNDVCNVWSVGQGSTMQFTPAAVSTMIFMRYETTPSDLFRVPVSVKDCWVEPGAFHGALRLSFELFVCEEVFYAAVNFAFPKRCRIVSFDHQNVGSFRNSRAGGGEDTNEMIWELGTFLKDDCRSTTSASPSSKHPSRMQLPDETLVAREAAPDLGHRLAQVRFVVNYVLLNEAGEILVQADPDENFGGEERKPNRRERRAAARAGGGASGGASPQRDDSVQVPGICVSYKTASTASGLEVRKLEPRGTIFNWNYPGSSVLWIAQIADKVLRPKLRKEISIVTAFSQVIRVESRL